MNYSLSEMVQRNHDFCIVDEVDSILIDEARTPLIISGPVEHKPDQYLTVDKLIKDLHPSDYEIDEKDKNVLLTNIGIDKIEGIFTKAGILKNNNFYDPKNLNLVHHVNQALRANHLFFLGKDYIVQNNSIKIIDEFTGRVLEGRRYSDGLHQALEAKEKVDILSENQTLANITYQNYFRMYKKLAGMTGTALTEQEEFLEIYNLGVVEIPTNQPITRIDEDDQVFRSTDEKYNAVANEIQKAHLRRQPTLVGT
jgi:preprotein translocase subunit SecA